MIGITERGDAGINFEWVNKLNTVDGVVLITKNLNDKFINTVLNLDKPAIVHCTCTGWGETVVEPNVPNYMVQLSQLKKLIDLGFNPNNVVLRIDPIFPTNNGLKKVVEVLNYFISLNTGVNRVRISVLDEYKHVKERFVKAGYHAIYDGFYASDSQFADVCNTLSKFNMKFEVCAENKLASMSNIFEVVGCISARDLSIMNIKNNATSINPQNRHGCHCLSVKKELLDNRKPCQHKCLYCYWK